MFKNLTLIKEYPNGVGLNIPLRLYRTESEDDERIRYRWHFGYQEKFIKPLCPLIESTPFWGEQHWIEIEGYWLWWLSFTTEDPEIPKGQVNWWYKWYGRQFDMCVNYCRKNFG